MNLLLFLLLFPNGGTVIQAACFECDSAGFCWLAFGFGWDGGGISDSAWVIR